MKSLYYITFFKCILFLLMQLRSFILISLYIVGQRVYCLSVLFKVLSMLHLGVSGIILLIKEAPF